MDTSQLIKQLESNEYILPKDILARVSEEDLVREIEEIFKAYPQKIEAEDNFRSKYIELVNYLLISNLRREGKARKKPLFDKNLISYLLSTPEMA